MSDLWHILFLNTICTPVGYSVGRLCFFMFSTFAMFSEKVLIVYLIKNLFIYEKQNLVISVNFVSCAFGPGLGK